MRSECASPFSEILPYRLETIVSVLPAKLCAWSTSGARSPLPHNHQEPVRSPNCCNLIRARYAQAVSVPNFAREYGISKNCVYRYLAGDRSGDSFPARLRTWRRHYYNQRPHSSLGYYLLSLEVTGSTRYSHSEFDLNEWYRL